MALAREIPLVPGLPVVGSALDVFSDPGRALIDAYRTYGPAFRVNVLGSEVVVLAGNEAHQFVQESGERHLSRHEFFRTFSRELGVEDIILGASGARHTQLRAALKLGFCREAIAPHVPALAAVAHEAAEMVPPGRAVRLLPLLSRLCGGRNDRPRLSRDGPLCANAHGGRVEALARDVAAAARLSMGEAPGVRADARVLCRTRGPDATAG